MARPPRLDEIPTETLRAGIVHLMQLAYAYEARDPSWPVDADAFDVLHDAVVAAAKQRDELVVRYREDLAVRLLPELSKLVHLAKQKVPRASSRRIILGCLVHMLGVPVEPARLLSTNATDPGWVREQRGPVLATIEMLAQALGCSASHIGDLRKRPREKPFSPFGSYPHVAGLRRRLAGRLSEEVLFSLFVLAGPGVDVFRYFLALVDWPEAEERDEMARRLAGERDKWRKRA
jgi:hypothetical protein